MIFYFLVATPLIRVSSSVLPKEIVTDLNRRPTILLFENSYHNDSIKFSGATNFDDRSVLLITNYLKLTLLNFPFNSVSFPLLTYKFSWFLLYHLSSFIQSFVSIPFAFHRDDNNNNGI